MMRGASLRALHWRITSIGTPVNISRTPVIPFATSLANGGSASGRCMCMSHRPGMRNLPFASMIRASRGMATFLPIAVMRAPSTTTVVFLRGFAPVASMTVARRMAIGCAAQVTARTSTAALEQLLNRRFKLLHRSLTNKGTHLLASSIVQKHRGQRTTPLRVDRIDELVVVLWPLRVNRRRDTVFLEHLQRRRFLLRLIGRDRHQLEPARLKLLAELDQFRHFRAARLAPRGPEIHQHYLA